MSTAKAPSPSLAWRDPAKPRQALHMGSTDSETLAAALRREKRREDQKKNQGLFLARKSAILKGDCIFSDYISISKIVNFFSPAPGFLPPFPP